MSGMSSEQRAQLTKLTIVDCIAESPTIAKYFEDHPEINPDGVDLGSVIDAIDKDYMGWTEKIVFEMPERPDDPYLDILKDYRERCDRSGTSDFSDLKVRDFTQEDGLGKYVTIQTGISDGKTTYQVCFSGTGNSEGITDAQGMYKTSTVQQQRALNYFYDMADKFEMSEGLVDISGHSNGGNKSGYVLMNAYGEYQNRIRYCLSLDGQGYSESAVEQWKESPYYKNKLNKLYGIYGEYDYVHPLGESIVPENHCFYVDFNENLFRERDIIHQLADTTTVFPLPSNENIENLGMLHMLNYLFKTDDEGRFIAELQNDSAPSELVEYERAFMKTFMKLPPYKRERAMNLLSLLWSGLSPDGTMADTGIKNIFDSLLDCIGGTDQAAFRSFVNCILKLIKCNDKFRHIIGASLHVFGFFTSGNGIPGDYEYEKRKAYDKYQKGLRTKAQETVAFNQGFTINPSKMVNLASTYQYLGGKIRNVGLKPAKILKINKFSEVTALRSTTGYSHDADLREKIIKAGNRLNRMIDDYEQAVKLLNECTATVNGALDYLNDTGNAFNRLESDLCATASQFEKAGLGITR